MKLASDPNFPEEPYFAAFNSWAQAKGVNTFYFEAFNERWKSLPDANEGPQGAHWGIRNAAGILKTGTGLVYRGYTLPESVYGRTPLYDFPSVQALPAATIGFQLNATPVTRIQAGQTAQVSASFAAAPEDFLKGTSVIEAGINAVFSTLTSATNASLSPLGCSFTPTAAGLYCFFADASTSNFPSTADYASAQMLVTPPPGPPAILLTGIPAYGAGGNVTGYVFNASPANCEVGAYIDVGGGWWSKPTFDNPTVAVNSDGSFSCDVTTGGYDADASQISIFVWPTGYNPPEVGGGSVPSAAFANAIAYTNISRPGGYPGYPLPEPNPPGGNGGTAGQPCVVSSLGMNLLSEGVSGNDVITLAGSLPLEGGSVEGVPVGINIGSGSNYWQFNALAKNGTALASGGNLSDAAGRIAMRAGKNKWTYTATLKCAPGATNCNPLGILNANIQSPGIPVFLNVEVDVAGQPFTNIVSGVYTARQGVAGSVHGNSIGLGNGL
jgi:hypothetical protein